MIIAVSVRLVLFSAIPNVIFSPFLRVRFCILPASFDKPILLEKNRYCVSGRVCGRKMAFQYELAPPFVDDFPFLRPERKIAWNPLPELFMEFRHLNGYIHRFTKRNLPFPPRTANSLCQTFLHIITR